jgi:hypothetical protein
MPVIVSTMPPIWSERRARPSIAPVIWRDASATSWIASVACSAAVTP